MVEDELAIFPATETVWRIGRRPEPWAWSGWEWATSGRFPGRWDDWNGNFRTVYAGSSLKACLLELLASFRTDARLAAELDDIVEDGEDGVLYPTVPTGVVPRDWFDGRVATTADLAGNYCAVTDSKTISALYPHFIALALSLGLHDFDASALKDAKPRQLTQSIASWLYETTDVDGVTFRSRHGDDLQLWAVFERPEDPIVSPNLSHARMLDLHPEDPEVKEAFEILRLKIRDE